MGFLTNRAAATTNHIPALDGLRGLAAVIVVVSHISNATGLWNVLLGAGAGQIGVMLFFVLSGYLMAYLYVDRPFTGAEVWTYAVRRVARVLPLFYLVVLAAVALEEFGRLASISLTFYAIGDLPRLLLLIRGTDVFWTIPVEIHFYILFLAVWWLHAKSPLAAFVAVAVAIVSAMLAYDEAGFSRFLFHAPFFLSGVLVSRLSGAVEMKSSRVDAKALALAVVFASVFLIFPGIWSRLFGTGSLTFATPEQMWHHPVYLIVVSGCLLAALRSRPVAAFLSSRPLVGLGNISYSIYLLHIPVVIALARFTPLVRTPELFLIAGLAATIAIAAISYICVELPARRGLNALFAPRKRTHRPSHVADDALTAG